MMIDVIFRIEKELSINESRKLLLVSGSSVTIKEYMIIDVFAGEKANKHLEVLVIDATEHTSREIGPIGRQSEVEELQDRVDEDLEARSSDVALDELLTDDCGQIAACRVAHEHYIVHVDVVLGVLLYELYGRLE